ncbi:MAG: AmmeMemoRadiSam system radical SAM enzyme [Pirellulales bacterium]
MPLVVTLPPEEHLHADGTKTAGWWHESERPGRVVCDLCPRACTLKPGDRGFCFVRENRDGRMVLSTYGRSTGFCIDPIEKKPLNQFYPGTSVLSFGTAGCNLGCKFCQNWSQSRSREIERISEAASPDDIAEAAVRAKCRSVAFTYNDPIVFAEYAIDTARACRQLGVKTVAVTNGYISAAARGPFFESMDAANVDLKGFSEDFYRRLTVSHLAPVLDTLGWLHRETGVWLEITNLIIPGENDSLEEIGRMCAWLADNVGPDVPLHFTAFHPDYQLPDRPATPLETLVAAHEVARKAGLHYVYTGNVDDPKRQNTFCPSCGKVVIERRGYELGAHHLSDGRCAHCGAAVAGRFDPAPGDWGSRRMPIQIRPHDREAERRRKAAPTVKPCDWAHLDGAQELALLCAAGRVVSAAAHGQRLELSEVDLPGLADRPIIGAFVTLKRGGQLRSCCGFLGPSVSLADGLTHASARAATDDPRFPPISPGELKHLDLDVWLLFGLEPITAQGEDRVREVVIGTHGLQVTRGSARGLLLPCVAVDHHMDAERFLQQTCLKAGLPPTAWLDDDTALMRFQGHSIHGRIELVANGLAEEAAVRRAAVAGMFYPADPGDLQRMLDDFLPGPPRPEPWRGILVPHAGLIYSGRVAGAVYQRVQFPETAIILCPRHTGAGAEWAVAPHEAWETPGGQILSDPELARRLAEAIGGLELDARAHAEEHAIEVQLPFFARLAPKTRVVGIAVGGASLERCREFAAGLASVIRDLPTPPLLVISSDMNHFADDQENRRLDAIALAAIEQLDPEEVYHTVRQNGISMCGMLPAVIVLEALRLLGTLSHCERVAYATSAEASGDDRRVVGYAGMLFG